MNIKHNNESTEFESENVNDLTQYYMYILVNTDLNMGKGKIAGQVGHVVGSITEKILTKSFESNTVQEDYLRYIKWKNDGGAKIILKATLEQITAFIDHPESIYIMDQGRTQIPANSLTVLGFYPSATLKEKLKNFKLL